MLQEAESPPIPWPESEKHSDEEVIELEPVVVKDPGRCCNCSDSLELILILRKDICDLKEQVADFISKKSCGVADVCSAAEINNELRHQRELNERLSNNLHLERGKTTPFSSEQRLR